MTMAHRHRPPARAGLCAPLPSGRSIAKGLVANLADNACARTAAAASVFALLGPLLVGVAAAHADNKRLNDGVVANVYTAQRQAGCTTTIKINPQLQLAAQWHTLDVLNNRNLDGDIGSDGSTPQIRAQAAGFHGNVAETVAINPALAINNLDVLKQWYYNPADLAVMQNCANTAIGVWSANSLDRSVVVAVYGEPG